MFAIVHNARQESKCLLHHNPAYAHFMSTPAERLKTAREVSGYPNAKVAAEAMGVKVATYIQHENGTRGLPAGRADRYARFFRTSPEWLLFGKEIGRPTEPAQLGPQVSIQGEVAAGVFKERMEFPEDEWTTFTGRADCDVPLSQRFGLRVAGDSMDIIYPPGSILECARYWGDTIIPNGKRVIVQRTHENGTVETTVKEYLVDGQGVTWLLPRSRNPAFQAPFRCDQPESGIVDIRVVGVVLASTIYE